MTGVGLIGSRLRVASKRRVDGVAMGEQALGLGQGRDRVADAGEPLARDPLDLR